MTTAATANQQNETSFNLTDLDDATLARRALINDEDVWREFVRRFEPVIRHQLGRTRLSIPKTGEHHARASRPGGARERARAFRNRLVEGRRRHPRPRPFEAA